DLASEEYLVDLAQGTPAAQLGRVRRESWSPNQLVLGVETHGEARLAVNQNYHPGWRSNVGRVESWDGLLSVVLPAGSHQVTLQFRPRSGIGGLWATALSLIAGALFTWSARKGWQRGALLALGPACIGALLILWPEAPWEHPAPVTPAGTPALLSALPGGAARRQVRFDTPLMLVGSRLPTTLPSGTREVTLDLFFERTGPISPALGIFVHVKPPEGARIQADHTEISGQLYLPRIPLDVIALDSFRVALPDSPPPGRYQVRVGLWNAYGDGARRTVIDAGESLQRDNMVSLGSFTVEGTP
ncbi:MAG TPA: hypothetical protein VFZ61_15335, partial [Polyangiales bacterium]